MSTKPLYTRVINAYGAHFGRRPSLLVQAPGRVNIIGEHTDYNDGFVLPCAIGFQTAIAASPRRDGLIRALAVDIDGETDEFATYGSQAKSPKSWANYVRGAVNCLLQKGVDIGGADLAIAGDIPRGTGLSSSASLLVAVIKTLGNLNGVDIPLNDLALLAQKAENEFVGVNVGIMDHLISVRGVVGHALMIDCRSLDAKAVRLPGDAAVMIVNSGVQRGLVESAYNERREQCTAAAAFFGIDALRDLDLGKLDASRPALDDVIYRRARHIVTENQRVIDACAAMEAKDLALLGRLMVSSHASMRDDFEITVPKVDELVEVLNNTIGGAGGARMTGGGFGGCCVAVMPGERVPAVREAVLGRYKTPDGTQPAIYVCSAEAGVGVVSGDS